MGVDAATPIAKSWPLCPTFLGGSLNMQNDSAVHPQDDVPQKVRVQIQIKQELQRRLVKTLDISLCLCFLFYEIGLVIMLATYFCDKISERKT